MFTFLISREEFYAKLSKRDKNVNGKLAQEIYSKKRRKL